MFALTVTGVDVSTFPTQIGLAPKLHIHNDFSSLVASFPKVTVYEHSVTLILSQVVTLGAAVEQMVAPLLLDENPDLQAKLPAVTPVISTKFSTELYSAHFLSLEQNKLFLHW